MYMEIIPNSTYLYQIWYKDVPLWYNIFLCYEILSLYFSFPDRIYINIHASFFATFSPTYIRNEQCYYMYVGRHTAIQTYIYYGYEFWHIEQKNQTPKPIKCLCLYMIYGVCIDHFFQKKIHIFYFSCLHHWRMGIISHSILLLLWWFFFRLPYYHLCVCTNKLWQWQHSRSIFCTFSFLTVHSSVHIKIVKNLLIGMWIFTV